AAADAVVEPAAEVPDPHLTAVRANGLGRRASSAETCQPGERAHGRGQAAERTGPLLRAHAETEPYAGRPRPAALDTGGEIGIDDRLVEGRVAEARREA